ncbi:MAG: hypothetical protein MI702_00735 [Chlorobiales bacterium]|nr:hypothetical protein [Chlorobiales bacterium]
MEIDQFDLIGCHKLPQDKPVMIDMIQGLVIEADDPHDFLLRFLSLEITLEHPTLLLLNDHLPYELRKRGFTMSLVRNLVPFYQYAPLGPEIPFAD